MIEMLTKNYTPNLLFADNIHDDTLNGSGVSSFMDDLTDYDPIGHSILSSSAPELHGEWMEVKRKVRLAKKKEVLSSLVG
jgi:hypothetical protein